MRSRLAPGHSAGMDFGDDVHKDKGDQGVTWGQTDNLV